MGLIPARTKEAEIEFKKKYNYQQSVIKENGFKYLDGWFGKLENEFWEKYKYSPCYHKDGKIYAKYQVIYLLNLEEKHPTYIYPWDTLEELPDYEYWENRRKVLLEELGRPYWLITEID